LGAEVWLTLIDAGQPAPTDPSGLAFLTMATKPSIRANFRAGAGGTRWGGVDSKDRWIDTWGGAAGRGRGRRLRRWRWRREGFRVSRGLVLLADQSTCPSRD